MRITNLHLIVSFFILSAFGFVVYRQWRNVTPPASAIRSLFQSNSSSNNLNTSAYIEQSRQRAKDSLERALDALQSAMSRDSRVAGPFIAYRRAKNLFDGAATAGDFSNARNMADEVTRQLAGVATARSPSPALKLDSYVVRRGDNLWNIAKKPEVYGRGSGWVRIWRANELQVPDFSVIVTGQELKIPR